MNLRWKHKGVSPLAGRPLTKLLLEVNPFVNGSRALLVSGCEFLAITQQPAPQNAMWLMPAFEISRTTLERPRGSGASWGGLKFQTNHTSISISIWRLTVVLSTSSSLLLCSSSFTQGQIPRWNFSPAFRNHPEMSERTLLIMPEGKSPAEHICLMSPGLEIYELDFSFPQSLKNNSWKSEEHLQVPGNRTRHLLSKGEALGAVRTALGVEDNPLGVEISSFVPLSAPEAEVWIYQVLWLFSISQNCCRAAVGPRDFDFSRPTLISGW